MVDDLDARIAAMEKSLIEASLAAPSERPNTSSLNARDVGLIEAVISGIAPQIIGRISASILPIARELQQLKTKMLDIADRGIRYRGVYQPSESYGRGDVTTCDGGLWIATGQSTGVKPGAGVMWQLAVKSAQPPSSGGRASK